MGETNALLTVYGARGSIEIDALVDTGATFTKIPRSAAQSAGLEETYQTPVQLGDGTTITRFLVLAEVEVQGIR